MKVGANRKYTKEFREAAIKQVIDGGRSTPSVARSLEMSPKTLARSYLRRPNPALLWKTAVHPDERGRPGLRAGPVTFKKSPSMLPPWASYA